MDKIHSTSDHVSELQRLLTSEKVLDSMAAGIVLQGVDGTILDCNHAATQLLGISREELMGVTSTDTRWEAVREDGTPVPLDERPSLRAMKSGKPSTGVVEGIDIPGRARRWVSVNSCPVTLDKGIEAVVSSFIDISSRVQRERLLKLLTEVNRDVLLATTEAQSLQELCDALVEKGGYALAWIAVLSSPDDGGIEIAYAAGETGYLREGMISWWGTNESGRGPTGTALRTGATQVVEDLTDNDQFAPWRERAAQFALGSSIAIAFTPGGRRAALNIYDRHISQFDGITTRGLEVIAREVELSIAHVRSVEKTEAALRETKAAFATLAEREKALSDSDQRFRIAFENNMSPMVLSDLDDRMTAANDAFCQMVGFPREELLGFDSKLFTYPDDVGITEETLQRMSTGGADQLRYSKHYLRKDGRVIISEISRSPARDVDGNILYYVFSERDVTEERALTSQLSHQALHDPLTGLANRALFNDRLSQSYLRVARNGGLGAVLILDLDDFKGVNDTHGHVVGDQLLVAIAHRFEHVARSSDTLCRFGGDEFLYLAEGLSSPAEAEMVAARLLEALVEPFKINGSLLEQHASIGIVVWSGADTESDEFVQNADVALYQAKRQGKGKYIVFTPSMREQVAGRFELVQELRHALTAGTLSMHYQPIVNLATTEVVGFEALMRWKHAERGWVPPDVFIPLAEQSDLILELGAFALNEAVTAASSWIQTGAQNIRPYVSVNLSAHQFQDPGLASKIEGALTMSGLPPRCLVIEITESVTLLDVAETSSVVERLNRLGVDFALDDFGTGYSSLSYLAALSPRIIKVDQSFVNPSLESERNDTLLEAIISLGNKLDGTMLAEGIETVEQLERLRQLDCELGQGFLFSPAVPVGEVPEILRNGPSQWGFMRRGHVD
jgi:diguanylate cyclase (GGDEF)-like protein/PAS domain S-box-containing protein